MGALIMRIHYSNKVILFFLLVITAAQTYAGENSAIVVNAKPTDVTVYADRAQVTRTLIKVLNKGSHTLIFDHLPTNIDQNSIQVNGKGSVELVDVKYKKVFLKNISNKKTFLLKGKLQSINDQIRIINNSIDQAKAEKSFVIKITEKLTNTTQKNSKVILDPQKWMKMVSFYRKKISSLDKEIYQADLSKRELKLDLEKIRREIGQIGASTSKAKNQVHIKVSVAHSGRISLKVSYLVYGPNWRPVYDLRVNSKTKIMSMAYKAMVRQSSGEDWSGVKLKLSTARPSISAVRPKLNTWYVNIYNLPARKFSWANRESALQMEKDIKSDYDVSRSRAMYNKKNKAMFEKIATEKSSKPMVRQKAAVDSLGLNAVFVIRQNANIKSDNNAHQVSIFTRKFKSEMRYSVIPKVSEHAFLKAKVTNDTDYPLLAGPANVFLNGSFVAQSRIKSVAPKEKFWTYLGVDNGVKVSYKFINKFHEKVGVFSSSKRDTYEYLITVKNNKSHSTAIHIWDQIPLAKNEDIKVKLISPEISEDTKNIKVNKQKLVEWVYQPKAGETIKIPFKFSVERPANKVLTNIKG